MVSSTGANSIPLNATRPPGVPAAMKRKFSETIYSNEQQQYSASAKMPLQSTGELSILSKEVLQRFHFPISLQLLTTAISTKFNYDTTK